MWDELLEVVAHAFTDLPDSGRKWIWIACLLMSIGLALAAWHYWPSPASWVLIASSAVIAVVAFLAFRSVKPLDD